VLPWAGGLSVDVWSNPNLLGSKLWTSGNPPRYFYSAPSLLGVHPISLLRLEINPGDLQLIMGSNNSKHITYSKLYVFKRSRLPGEGLCPSSSSHKGTFFSAVVRLCNSQGMEGLAGMTFGGGKSFIL